jgi:hypothetical protein
VTGLGTGPPTRDADLGKVLRELGDEGAVEAEPVGVDEHLAVQVAPVPMPRVWMRTCLVTIRASSVGMQSSTIA